MMVFESFSGDDAVGGVRYFLAGFVAALIFGVSAVVLVFIWTFKYLGGVGWSTSGQIFNYHPLFMIAGFIFLYGNAILTYRVLRNKPKKVLKLIHAGINGLALAFAAFAFWAAIHLHNANNFANFKSLHSWAGLLTLSLFAGQFLIGFGAFLFPGVAVYYRRLVLPYHVYLGSAIFVSACATALMGLQSSRSGGVLTNFLGITIILFCASVVYLLSDSRYKRTPLPEEQLTQPQTLVETSQIN